MKIIKNYQKKSEKLLHRVILQDILQIELKSIILIYDGDGGIPLNVVKYY
jgi:hypothetical protein